MNVILSIILSTITLAQSASLDSLFTPLFSEREPGAAVLIVRNGKVCYERCCGIADIQTGAEISPDTFFNIASCSKQFTAVAVLQLMEQGKLKLSDRVRDYFPEYTNPIWDKITIEHLLTHSSGIPDERGYLTREQKIKGDDALALEYLKTLDHLLSEPGKEYKYMNPTFVLLGELVSRVSGMEFEEYMRKNVFKPAGMKNAVYYGPEKDIPQMAHAYKKAENGWEENDYGEDTFFATRPDGGIYSSLNELLAWNKALNSNRVLKKKTLDEAWKGRIMVKSSGKERYYCYGWMTEPVGAKGSKAIFHYGGNGSFRSIMARYPESETLVIVLTNRPDLNQDKTRYSIEKILEL